MRYEILWGSFTHWCEAPSPVQAGIQAWQSYYSEEGVEPILMDMQAINMDTWEEETVELSLVCGILLVAQDYDPNDNIDPLVDPQSDLGRAMARL